MKLGIDIDDSITQTTVNFISWHNQTYGTDLSYAEFHTQNFSEILKTEQIETAKRVDEWVASDFVTKIELVTGAEEILPLLFSTFDCYFITGRLESRKNETTAFLKKYIPECEDKIFYAYNPYRGDGGKTKLELCKELGIDVLIEDSEGFAKDCLENGIKVLLIDHPWNRHLDHPNTIRMKDWFEIQTWLTNYKPQ